MPQFTLISLFRLTTLVAALLIFVIVGSRIDYGQIGAQFGLGLIPLAVIWWCTAKVGAPLRDLLRSAAAFALLTPILGHGILSPLWYIAVRFWHVEEGFRFLLLPILNPGTVVGLLIAVTAYVVSAQTSTQRERKNPVNDPEPTPRSP